MEKIEAFFFDSYAFYEIFAKNKNYEKYTKEVIIVTTKLNLMEVHYGLLRKYGKETADNYYGEFVKYTVEIKDEMIKEANVFRLHEIERRLSYVDCMGYIINLDCVFYKFTIIIVCCFFSIFA